MKYTKTFWDKLHAIPGLFMERHAHVIYGLIKSLRPNTIVEVGCYKGYTTAVMSHAMKEVWEGADDGTIFVLDNFSLENGPELVHNYLTMLGVGDNVLINKGDSADSRIWPNSVDLAFIDGNHSLTYLMSDFNNAAMRGADCIIVHDTLSWWGPNNFVTNFIASYEGSQDTPRFVFTDEWTFIEFPYDQGLAVFMRKQKRPTDFQPAYSEDKYPKGYVENSPPSKS